MIHERDIIEAMKVSISGETQNMQPPKHGGDLGYDLIASSDPKIVGITNFGNLWERLDYIEYDTGVKIDTSESSDLFCLAYSRSSISNTNLYLANGVGVIDVGYRGNILIRFKYLPQPSDLCVTKNGVLLEINPSRIYKKGDRIAQIVFAKGFWPELNECELSESDRKEKGFGSTGS